MKTKFFKKLSFVLAVAMVLSVFAPAAGAFAAGEPKLNSTKKYLHLSGKPGSNEFNFDIKNKVKGWKYFWESADEAVAEVNEKNGVVIATGVGKTKITCTITDADGEEVAELVATVTVRDNIKEVTISNPVEKLAVGAEHDYNRSFVTESGSTKKTDSITRWTVEPADKATIDDKGVFVATEAGEFTVTARSFQSKAKHKDWLGDPEKYADYVLDFDITKVTVAGSMVEAKQVDLKTVDVTFDTAMEDVDKNISIHQMVGTTKVKQIVEKVKMSDDKKVATVSVYVPFTAGATYIVDYTGLDSIPFDAATTKIEDVASLQITTTTAVVNEATEVKFKLLNVDGVNITTPELSARVTMKSAGEVGSFFDGKNITIFNKDATAKITATFHTYKYDNLGNELGALEAAGVVVGIDKASQNIVGLNAWTIVNDIDPKFDDVKQQLAVGDSGYRLFVEFNTKLGSDDKKINSKDQGAKFDFTSSDKNVLIIDQQGNLYPVKDGSVVVVVSYGDAGSRTPIGAIPLNVSAKRAVGTFTLSSYNVSLTNSAAIDETAKVKITLKDQLGSDFNYSNVTIDKLSGPAQPTGVAEVVASQARPANDELVFSGNGRTAGEYAYKVTVEGMSAVVSVNILDSTGAVSYRKLSLSSSAIDVKADKDNKGNKDVTIEVIGYNNKGVKVQRENLAGGVFKIEVDAPYVNGAEWDYPTNETRFDTGTNKYALATGVSGSAVVKAPTGSYKVTAYEFKDHDSNASTDKVWVAFDVLYFTVSDTQVKPVVAEVKTRLFDEDLSAVTFADGQTNENLIKAVKDAIKFTLNGTETTAIQSVDVFGNANEFNIKAVTIREVINGGAYIDHKVNVGLTITYQP